MAAPGATFPSHLQPHRRTETHQQRLLEAQAELFAAKHPVQNGHTGGPTAKPAGLYNEGNTCFFNSTFQALAATTSLIDLIGPVIFPSPGSEPTQTGASTSTSSTTTSAHNIPDALDHPAKTYTTTATGSDNAPLYPHSIPSLLDAALEPENARLLPVTLAFEKCLGKAWRAKDEGLKGSLSAGSSPSPGSGSGKEVGKREASAEKEKSVSLKALLRELGKKYDQYEDVSLARDPFIRACKLPLTSPHVPVIVPSTRRPRAPPSPPRLHVHGRKRSDQGPSPSTP